MSLYYAGKEPQFVESNVFRIIVPLDDAYSYDSSSVKAVKGSNDNKRLANETGNADKMPESGLSTQQKSVYQFVAENGQITSHQAESLLGVKQRRARAILGEMVDQGVLERQGAFKSTVYVLKERR